MLKCSDVNNSVSSEHYNETKTLKPHASCTSLITGSILSIIILGTWLPELQHWCIAYQPDDLMMVNTNNGTECLNEDLKYDELIKYKNCTLCDLLAVIVERFIPKLYEKYTESNIKFTSTYRKYDVNIQHYIHNCPCWIVDDMLEKVGKISSEDVSVSVKDKNSFFV